MRTLEELEVYLDREYENLKKSKNRARSLQGILNKSEQLKDAFNKYEQIIKGYKYRVSEVFFEELSQKYKNFREIYFDCVKILENSEILSEKPEKPKKIVKMVTIGTQTSYEFPMQLAIQCIPDFMGEAEELDAFFYQIDIFARDIPEGFKHEPLIQIVMSKMKGKAKKFVNRVKDSTWEKTKAKISKEFGEHLSIGGVMEEVETLKQKPKESLKDYMERGLTILENIEAYVEEENDYAENDLKRHFTCGLRNADLKKLAKSEMSEKSFRELMEYLHEKGDEIEQLESLEKRISQLRFNDSPGPSHNFNPNYRGNNNFRSNNRNFNTNDRYEGNYNNYYNGQNSQNRNLNGQNFQNRNSNNFQNRDFNGQNNHNRNYNPPGNNRYNNQNSPGNSRYNNHNSSYHTMPNNRNSQNFQISNQNNHNNNRRKN